MNLVKKTKASRQSFGPISDLEKHLPSEWWKGLFNALYLKTDGDVVENDQETKQDVDLLIQSLQLTPDSKLLDLCCGQGRHVMELARRGFTSLVGIDRSRYLIRLAKKRSQASGFFIKFSEGDARKIIAADNSFDCVSVMGNSFGYFDRQDDDIKVLKEIKRVLADDGKIALDLADGAWLRKNFQARSWEWIDKTQFVCRERSMSEDKSKIISREVVVNTQKGVIKDQFYAERLYDGNQITNILTKLGFVNIVIHCGRQAASSRNQDLGMMAHRMFVTAQASTKKITSSSSPFSKKQEIVVLLGDPNLSDKIKKGGVFNPEDLETIEQLKKALGALTQYNFTYISDHKNLISMLEHVKADFVFNLCDEGYNNDARMELHVPALLEMLGAAYSGASPDGLAVCYNKSIVRNIALSLNIAVPAETYFDHNDPYVKIPTDFPVIVKPNLGDSSFGITKDAVVHNEKELKQYITQVQERMSDTSLLIQEFLPGDEYSVSIIGNRGNYTILPIMKVNYEKLSSGLPKILGYESKWLPDSPYWTHISYEQANIDEKDTAAMVEASIKMFERTSCRDYARFDFRADVNGVIKLLEVNPNPGWCWDGKLNLMAKMNGMTYVDMLELILKVSRQRYNFQENSDQKLLEI